MSDLIETIMYRGEPIEVFYSDLDENPNDWGNEDAFIVYDHRQFYVTRKYFEPQEIFNHVCETKNYFYDGYYVFTLYAYIHSGVALSVSRDRYPFNDQWDVSTTGFVLIKKEKGTWTREQAFKRAEQLIVTWNQYLSGDVFGYSSEAGSCTGFYGKEGRKQMIEEAKAEIDSMLDDRAKEHFTKLKTWIKHRVPYYVRQAFTIPNRDLSLL